MLLILTPASAAPTSALINGIMQKSSSKPVSAQPTLDPAALIGGNQEKLAATSAELALCHRKRSLDHGYRVVWRSGYICPTITSQAVRLYLSESSLLVWQACMRTSAARLEMENQAANWSGFNEPSVIHFSGRMSSKSPLPGSVVE